MNVESFLRERHVPFDVWRHDPEFTASRTAHALHVPGDNFAKTVVLRVDGRPVLAVLQATHTVDMPAVRRALKAGEVRLAVESELKELFPDCEIGAVPPFGSEYGMETVVDDGLVDDEHIVFDANTHDQAVYMRYGDFEQLEHPCVAHISN